jgi:hypothetical protein
MKNIIFLTAMAIFIGFGSKASCFKHSHVVLDSVKVGFEKDAIKILEGDSTSIGIEIMGAIPKDSLIEISYIVKDADALTGKDFKLRTTNNFVFRTTAITLQRQFLELLTTKDNNEEREYIVLELAIVKGEKFAKLTKKRCLVLLKDFKTPTELAHETFKEETQNIVKNVQRIINADKDTNEVIGKIKLRNFKVGKYALIDSIDQVKIAKAKGMMDSAFFVSKKAPTKKDSIEIDTVKVLFKYGVAAEIKAYTKDGEVYSNLWYNGYGKSRTRVGISFRHQIYKDSYRNFYLIGKNDEKSAIRLLDLLDYDAKIGLNYPPGDDTVRLTKAKPIHHISVKTSLSSYVHLNLYSDLLNLLGTDPSNGLLQTEASAKIFLRTLPNNKRINFMLHYLSPYLKYSRFENGFRDIVPTKVKSETSTDSVYSIDRMLVNQRKFLDIGLKMNLFEHIGRFYNTAELNVLCNFGWVNERGKKDDLNSLRTGITQFESIPHNTLDLGIEGRYSIFQYRNFGINLGAMVFFQKIWNNKLTTFVNGGYQTFYRTEAELFYFPVANSKDKIFLRAYHVINNNPKEANFMQLQFGYKLQFKLPNGKLR